MFIPPDSWSNIEVCGTCVLCRAYICVIDGVCSLNGRHKVLAVSKGM